MKFFSFLLLSTGTLNFLWLLKGVHNSVFYFVYAIQLLIETTQFICLLWTWYSCELRVASNCIDQIKSCSNVNLFILRIFCVSWNLTRLNSAMHLHWMDCIIWVAKCVTLIQLYTHIFRAKTTNIWISYYSHVRFCGPTNIWYCGIHEQDIAVSDYSCTV